tara:strand:+ start:2258 stop:2590 length:333 start_codon:yes stop_codon:yes gene_type:complete
MSKDDKELETMAITSGGNFDAQEVELWTKNINLANYDGAEVITVNASDLAESAPSVTLKEVVFDNMLGEGAPGVTTTTTTLTPNAWYGHKYDNTDVTVTLNLNEEDPKEE